MRPTTAQLETFFWIARLGSVKEAAQHLNLAQPTISLRLQELEAQFQRTLFERGGRRLVLTFAGEALLPRAAALVQELTGIRELITGEAQSTGGVVRVGLSETFAHICLSGWMKLLARDLPGVQLDIAVGTSAELEHQVVERRLDLAFVINPVGDPKLAVIPLGIQDVTWAAAPELELPRQITPQLLASQIVITNPHPSPMYRQIIDWFREDGIEPEKICRCTSVTLATELVRQGHGVSLLPTPLIEPYLRNGAILSLLPSRQPTPSRLYCIYRFAEQNRLLDAVLAAARSAIETLNFLRN
ncbi:LysR family transcriptional regulator [Bosea sp. 2RAB26]|uniref:LysR family transcriptional regulator n=1 Tax=Bosea sp. 2RAB26 TaxID=3237476 RepID=UPI003F8DA44F